jgi:hypothetical protein
VFKRNLLVKISSLMLAGSMLVGVPAIIPAAQAASGHHDHEHLGNGLSSKHTINIAAPQISGSAIASQTPAVTGWTPARPVAGMGSIVFLNSFGSGAPLTVDLQKGNLEAVREDRQNTHQFIVSSDNLYTVPEATNSGMGRLQLNLAPGSYNYTASVPNIGAVNGSFDLTPGQVVGLNFYGGDPKTIVHNHSQSHGDNTKPTTISTVFTKLLVAPQDLTAQAR